MVGTAQERARRRTEAERIEQARRELASRGMLLKQARAARRRAQLGAWYAVCISTGRVLATHLDPLSGAI